MTKIHDKLTAIQDEMQGLFLERNREIDGMLCALLSREHILLLGDPGTAKSAMALALTAAFRGGNFFGRLLTKTTVPEELFGPLDLQELQTGNFRRKIEGYLPTADVAYLDEVFKSSSAVLNALLTAINEREFENPPAGWVWKDGDSLPRHAMPLRMIVGASNELPEGSDLSAFHDRFMLRFWCQPLRARRARAALLRMNGKPMEIQASMTMAELDKAIKAVSLVKVDSAVYDRMLDIRTELEEQSIKASDRRWRKVVRVLKARAYLAGSDTVEPCHMDLMADCLWTDPSDQATVRKVVMKLSNPLVSRAIESLDAARVEIEKIPDYDGSNADAILNSRAPVEAKLQAIHADLAALRMRGSAGEKAQIDAHMAEVESMVGQIKDKIARMLEPSLGA